MGPDRLGANGEGADAAPAAPVGIRAVGPAGRRPPSGPPPLPWGPGSGSVGHGYRAPPDTGGSTATSSASVTRTSSPAASPLTHTRLTARTAANDGP